MGRPRRSRSGAVPELDLLSSVGRPMLAQRLELGWWPDQARFPVNRATAKVRSVVWADLVGCSDPLVVTGFASIDQLVDLIGAWGQAGHQGRLRIGLGWEPFASATSGFGPPRGVFTDTVRAYWQDRGVSLEACGRLVQAVELVRAGRVQVRFAHGDWRCHAKVYATENAVTMGSSNFTATGLTGQIEANTRFEAATDAVRHHEACQVAERIWEVSEPWEQDFLDLLEGLLRFTSWQEALARACAELIEGDWAGAYLPAQTAGTGLWPSQVAGIAQALWILESVGSVLVADATGSGKTRMGAHLARASVDWLWGTGRVRGTAPAVLVAPPGVRQAWRDEGDQCQMTFRTYSQGDLSTTDPEKAHRVTSALARAQLLAVDEAHNYLSTTSLRTQRLMGHGADHVMLFTATPISRGARDLLQLVRLLGVDNFDDTTIEVLRTLERAPKGATLAHEPLAQLRREIQRFTVRRTKPMLNTAVDNDPEAYRDPDSGQVNRYPAHTPHAYDTGETDTDQQVALAIRAHAGALRGLGNLGNSVTRPIGLPVAVTDQRFLEIRLAAAAGLAAYQVTDALRSSRAALLEHILGTGAAADYENIPTGFKASDSGDQLARTLGLAGGPPPALDLRAQPPDWLTDPTEWEAACRAEAEHYRAIHELACQLSDAREKAKATLIVDLQLTHQQVLVFDRHPISLAVLTSHLQAAGASNVLIATGSTATGKKQVTRALARSADQPAIALCSDALNEGLNLQGAPVIVHLDLPTTLRVAEQRVGRVERMNTRHPRIESWWPRDSAAFATRARERLQARKNESEQLLGANLDLPPLDQPEAVIDLDAHIAQLTTPAETAWDQLLDALDPVRRLAQGPDALIPPATYTTYRTEQRSVLARVSPVASTTPWAFLAIKGTQTGAPHWLLLEGHPATIEQDLAHIADRLRTLLGEDPPPREPDDTFTLWLRRFLATATAHETRMLPRRQQRALGQMARITDRWRSQALASGDYDTAARWAALHALANPDSHDPTDQQADPRAVAHAWLHLMQPLLDAPAVTRNTRLLRLADLDPILRTNPLPANTVEHAMRDLPTRAPLANRVAAAIIGVPGPTVGGTPLDRP